MLKQLEHSILYFINSTCHSPVLDKIMPYVTEIVSGGAIFVLALVLIFLKKREHVRCGILLMAGSTFSYHSARFIKDLIQRPRPHQILDWVRAVMPLNGFAFPSGHATMAFMAAFILTKYFKRWYMFYPMALIVSLSRIYLGVHYASDVIAGAILGSIVGLVLVYVAEPEL